MPRRKRGRDKPQGRRRNRKNQGLFVLNTQAAWKIGEPKPNFKPDPLVDCEQHREQRRAPYPEGRALEDVLVLDIIEGRHYLRGKKGVEENDVAA